PVRRQHPSQWLMVGVDDIHPDAAATDTTHHGTQGSRRTTSPTDNLTEIIGVNVYFECAGTAVREQFDPDIVRVVDDASDQVLQRISGEAHACSCLSDAFSSACALSEEPESASSAA